MSDRWEFEVPKYRTTRSLHPSPNPRHATETPFSFISDDNVWQYADRPLAAHQEFSTTAWPHSSMQPLNQAARVIHSLFCEAEKSKLPPAPWSGDRVRPEIAEAMS
jgi:hypothetical protein